jgi:hypothetical protein
MRKRQLDIRLKFVVLTLVALVAIASGSLALVRSALRGMKFNFPELNSLAKAVSAIDSLEKARLPACSSAIKRPAAGDARQEATMAYVAGVVDLYRTTFGKFPDKIGDLDKLPTFENADKLNGNEMKRNCSLQQMLSSHAYVLSCGGKQPSVGRLQSALSTTVDTQFAIVDGIEVLHVPLAGGCI